MGSKELELFISFLFLISLGIVVFTPEVSAQTTCSSADQIILRLSSATNAHGEVFDGAGGYIEEICYDTIFGVNGSGVRTCTGTNKVVGLSDTTNAHAESPSESNYATEVCYGSLSCVGRSGGCLTGESLVVSLSDTTNAHLSNSAGYGIDICCSIGIPPPPTCSFTDAYWSTTSGSLEVMEGTSVELIVEGDNCIGKEISFEVKEYDLANPDDDVITNPDNATFSGGSVTGTWTAEWESEGGLDPDPEYYFNATVVGEGESIETGRGGELLEVTEFVSPSCDGIVICGDYTTQSICNADSCGVAGVNVPTNIDCDDPSITCECSWNSTNSECEDGWDVTTTDNGDTEIGKCRYTQGTGDNCDDGFLTFNWTATWTWAVGNEIDQYDPEGLAGQCVDGSKTIECPAQIPLPFFGVYNFIIALLMVASIYAFLTLGKRKKKK